MDSSISTLLLQYKDHMQEEQEVREEARQDEVIRYMTKFHKFEMLDSVFNAFMDTNNHLGQHFSLEDLLTITERHDFRYYHCTIPYLATVYPEVGCDAHWLNIKLMHDGFVYSQRQRQELHRHMSPGWLALAPHKFLPHLSGMLNALLPRWEGVRAFYNHTLQRFDVKVYPGSSAPAGTPHLLITFEAGYPDGDDTVPMHSLR